MKSTLSVTGLRGLENKENPRQAIHVEFTPVQAKAAAPPTAPSPSCGEPPRADTGGTAPAAVEGVLPPPRPQAKSVLTHVASGVLGALLWHLLNLPRQRRGRSQQLHSGLHGQCS
jgi:hypothetical protein